MEHSYVGHEVAELLGGGHADLVAELTQERRVVTDGVGGVAFGEVDADHQAVRAFPQRLGGDSGQRGVKGWAVFVTGEEFFAGGFQGMQAQLAGSFAFLQDPVVVPAGQQYPGVQWIGELGHRHAVGAFENAVGACVEFVGIDVYRVAEV